MVRVKEIILNTYKIPFNKPSLSGNEFEYMAQAIQAGHISGDGVFTRKCSDFLEFELGVPKVMLTTSCTHALEMAALLLDVQPGDEVIIPSFTFVSTVNAFVLRGARPIFIDVRSDTLNLDESLLERLITPKTKAIVPVHYAGVGCEMEAILELSSHYHLRVVEDNAHGLFGRYRGQLLGTFGCLATQSFHETKNFTCGEGGAILINEPQYIEKAEIIREKGTNRSRFFRGQVDKYTWVDIGSSYLPSDVLAAFLLAQLESRQQIQSRRRQIWETYNRELEGWAGAEGIRLPMIPSHCEQPYHMYYTIFPSLETRTAFIAKMKTKGILMAFHYQPLHLSDMGTKFGGKGGDCPVTEQAADTLVRLPFYTSMTESEQAYVIDTIKSYRVS